MSDGPADGTASTPRAIESVAWHSAITTYDAEHVWVRGWAINDLIDELTFSGMIYLAWTGQRPDEPTQRLLDACLMAGVDHGPVTPSAIAARTASSVRQNPVVAVAAGLLTVTDFHGGAVTGCMELLAADGADDVTEWAREHVATLRAAGRRVPGVGHRVHTHDLRATRLLALIRELFPDSPVPDRAEALSAEVSRLAGRPITVNIDGGVAAGLVAIELPAEFGNLAFLLSRSVGLGAHVIEERTRERPMRTINPAMAGYDGVQPH